MKMTKKGTDESEMKRRGMMLIDAIKALKQDHFDFYLEVLEHFTHINPQPNLIFKVSKMISEYPDIFPYLQVIHSFL